MATCWIIAGPNGAGKTTFALEYLPEIAKCLNFVNADLIAAGLSPFAPEQSMLAASRIFLDRVESSIHRNESFAFETTLSGRTYLSLIDKLKAQSWAVELIYLALPSLEMSKLRVAERVAHGGHNIPLKDLERRFSRSLHNLLNWYSFKVDRCICYMNDGEAPQLIFEQTQNIRNVIHEFNYQVISANAIP
ncbi:hypothetical protein [Methylomagnum ishizawai]|uniref:hypothetical protein n=1 Tax=Methylomagnum ishizawai TaxID=1760988 RepID=UPI001C321E99|nr:hypothetical protein [Methylomagnum ishizawai]BBL73688.1 hypothetical protein MishRS11D_07860 [Methylomagnum ishizawai]